MNGKISFEIIYIDTTDDSLELRLKAQNELASTSLTFYLYSHTLKEFGESLINFPKHINNKFTFEVGSDDRSFAYHVLIEGYCSQPNGKIMLKILTDNHHEEPDKVMSLFFIETYPASINKLGILVKDLEIALGARIEWDSDS